MILGRANRRIEGHEALTERSETPSELRCGWLDLNGRREWAVGSGIQMVGVSGWHQVQQRSNNLGSIKRGGVRCR